MTLLEEFIFSLSRSERAKLRPLQFRGVKRKIFMKVLHCTDQEGIGVAYNVKLYKLTDKRYYQMHSEMLHACYKDIIPTNNIRILLMLGNKQLFRHFFHEMKRQEEEHRNGNNKKKLEEYYFKILSMRQLFILNEKMHAELLDQFEEYANRYLEVKAPDPDDAELIRIVVLAREQLKFQLKTYSIEKKRSYANKMEKISRKVFAGSHLLAKFLVSDLLMLSAIQINIDSKKQEQYARYGRELLRNHPRDFAEISDLYDFECMQRLPAAEQSSIPEIEEFLERSSEQYGPSIYFIGRFFVQIAISDDSEWIRKFIREHFPFNIDLLKRESAASWAFLSMLYNVYTGQYSEAELFLNKTSMLNSGKKKVLSLEITLRSLDAFLMAMRGDAIGAENHAARHLRYLQSHGYRDHKRAYYFLKFTADLMKVAGYDSEKAKKIREKFWSMEEIRSFRYLFDKMYRKYFPNQIL
jgi:hypothetical protein